MTPFWRGVSLRPIGSSCRDDSECITRLCRYSTNSRAGQRTDQRARAHAHTNTPLRIKVEQAMAWAVARSSLENPSGFKNSSPQVPRKSGASPFCSLPRLDTTSRGRKCGRGGWLWALLDLCLKNHLFFSFRKRRCSLSVAQE